MSASVLIDIRTYSLLQTSRIVKVDKMSSHSQSNDECIFCRIIRQRLEDAAVVYEDDQVIALVSLHQKLKNLGHTLLLPKAHCTSIYKLPSDLAYPLMNSLSNISGAIKSALNADGVQIRQNNDSAAGQDVFHLHFHIIPRFFDDGFDDTHYSEIDVKTREKLAILLRTHIKQVESP